MMVDWTDWKIFHREEREGQSIFTSFTSRTAFDES